MFVIVPNIVRDEINKRIDAALKSKPDLSKHREDIFNALLAYFDEHGVVPDFELEGK